jgi:tetratricopeptide (TPR) repeat protein
MRAHMKLLGIVICCLHTSSCLTSATQPSSILSGQTQELIIERDLGKAVMSWLADGNEPAALECDKLVDSLLELDNPTARSYFIAAQVANLRKNPHKAILALEKAIEKYPNEEAPIGRKVPTKIVGRLWIANIARQSGDTEQAQGVYKTLLSTLISGTRTIEGAEDKNSLIMTCQLYLAEIESEQHRNNQGALSHLKAIIEIEKPTALQSYRKASFDLRKSWAAYEMNRITRGRDEANSELSPVSEPVSAYLLAAQHLLLNGIAGEPLVGSRKGMNIAMDRLIDRAIQNNYSRIDRDVARLGYGYDQCHKGNVEKAEGYFSSLFQDDSFFSPVAGVSLARVKKAQNNNDEANSVLDQVSKKYPGYASVVAQARQSWK